MHFLATQRIVRRVMEEHDDPRLTISRKVRFQPLVHRLSLDASEKVALQTDEVNIAPVERIIFAPWRRGRDTWERVERDTRSPKVLLHVVIPEAQREWRPQHE